MADDPGPIDVDDGVDEGFAGDTISDSENLTDAMRQPRTLWGRKYHAHHADINDYWGPEDKQQQEALDWGRIVFQQLLGEKLFLAPMDIECIKEVLDVGCGTGAWAVDFADAHPHVQVEGIDISPIQGDLVPPNCRFYVEDVEGRRAHRPNRFDLVYIGCLMGAVRDWPALYRQAFHEIRPGGYIEHLEMCIDFASVDGSVPKDHILAEFARTIIDCGERVGKTFRVADNVTEWTRAAGFEDVQEQWHALPVGPWSRHEKLRRVGLCNYQYWDSGAEGLAQFLLVRVLGWSYEKSQDYITEFRNALRDRSNHAYHRVVVVWGRKPMN